MRSGESWTSLRTGGNPDEKSTVFARTASGRRPWLDTASLRVAGRIDFGTVRGGARAGCQVDQRSCPLRARLFDLRHHGVCSDPHVWFPGSLEHLAIGICASPCNSADACSLGWELGGALVLLLVRRIATGTPVARGGLVRGCGYTVDS